MKLNQKFPKYELTVNPIFKVRRFHGSFSNILKKQSIQSYTFHIAVVVADAIFPKYNMLENQHAGGDFECSIQFPKQLLQGQGKQLNFTKK